MNLDQLQSARSTERQRDSLQSLSDTFYADVGEFVRELRTERDRAAEAAEDPFDAPEVRRLTDDIKTAENTAEAIYERRVGKLVKLASLEAAGMATDDEGLTTEERDLFETLVARIEDSRARVLDDVLAGGGDDATADATATDATATGATPGATESIESAEPTDSAADPSADRVPPGESSAASGADVADAMGAGPDASPRPGTDEESEADAEAVEDAARADGAGADTANQPDSGPDPDAARAPSTGERSGMTPQDTDPRSEDTSPKSPESSDSPESPERMIESSTEHAGGAGGASDDPENESDASDTDRTTVRVTREVGEILGVDERVYDLHAEDVVTLPAVNAGPLVERDAAEPLDRA